MGNDHDHALGSTYFKLFGKGMSRGPDLHLGQAYGHKKTHELSKHVPPLKQLYVS